MTDGPQAALVVGVLAATNELDNYHRLHDTRAALEQHPREVLRAAGSETTAHPS